MTTTAPFAVYPLRAETDPATFVRAMARLPEHRCNARFVSDSESCTVAWEGGACGWDRREGKGLWVTASGQPYPTFYGRNDSSWRGALRAEIARGWLALQPKSPELQVFVDCLSERGLLHPVRSWLEQARTFQLVEGDLGALARQAVAVATQRELVAASWAARR